MEDCHWESGRRETQIRYEFLVTMGFPGVSDSKESACNAGDGAVEMNSRMTPWCLVCVTRKFKLLLPEMRGC